MKIVCNSKNEPWCPYGSEHCECDVYYPREIGKDELKYFDCFDNDDVYHNCELVEVPDVVKSITPHNSYVETVDETDAKVFAAKMNDLISQGYKVSSTNCGYIGEVGNDVYDIKLWMAILVRE